MEPPDAAAAEGDFEEVQRLQLALESADLELVDRLLARGAVLTDATLETAAGTGRIDVIERAFAAASGVGERPWRDGLLAATHRGDEDAVAALLADPRLILPRYALQDVWHATLTRGRSAVIDIIEPKIDRGYLSEGLLRSRRDGNSPRGAGRGSPDARAADRGRW